MDAPLPDAGRMAWWISAWLRGDESPDAVRDGVVGDDAAHHVRWRGEAPETLLLSLGRLRREGATAAGLALPAPGDPAGLGGPAAFNAAAQAVGEAVLLPGARLGLVPHRAGAGVVWEALPADRRPPPDLGEADRTLRAALPRAADALAALHVGRWRREVADDLLDLRRGAAVTAPAGTPERAVTLAARAGRVRSIVALALADDGASVSATEIGLRRSALEPLGRAARHALVAACSPDAWPPG